MLKTICSTLLLLVLAIPAVAAQRPRQRPQYDRAFHAHDTFLQGRMDGRKLGGVDWAGGFFEDAEKAFLLLTEAIRRFERSLGNSVRFGEDYRRGFLLGYREKYGRN